MAEKKALAPATSLGPIPLLEGIAVSVAAGRDGWVTSFTRGGETIAEDRSATLPWIDPRAPGRLAARLHEAVPLDQKAIRAALAEIFETIRSSPDAGALVSGPVARVIGETTAVKIEMSEPPVYSIDLDGGRFMIFSAKEIAAHRPITLNERWLSVHPSKPLKAGGPDFEAVIEYWLSIAEEVEPIGNVNAWEVIAERLQIRIAPLTVHPKKEGLLKTGLFQEEDGLLWIAGRVVAEVLKESGRNENDSGFSKYLQASGVLVHPSKPFRVGRIPIRAWGFTPDFRPEEPDISDFANLVAGEERP